MTPGTVPSALMADDKPGMSQEKKVDFSDLNDSWFFLDWNFKTHPIVTRSYINPNANTTDSPVTLPVGLFTILRINIQKREYNKRSENLNRIETWYAKNLSTNVDTDVASVRFRSPNFGRFRSFRRVFKLMQARWLAISQSNIESENSSQS